MTVHLPQMRQLPDECHGTLDFLPLHDLVHTEIGYGPVKFFIEFDLPVAIELANRLLKAIETARACGVVTGA